MNTGNRPLRTAEFAKSFSAYGFENVGAAGTFIAHRPPARRQLLAEVRQRLPFEAEVMVVQKNELLAVRKAHPFRPDSAANRVRRAASILCRPSRREPRLPLARPSDETWGVRLLQLRGRIVVSEYRRLGPQRMLYPNEVVEKEFGVPATTRWWETIETICDRIRP